MTTAAAGRKPGTAESIASWLIWLLVSVAAGIVTFTAIFPLAFSGAVPDQADAAAALFVWSLLTVVTCVAAAVAMGIGHLCHWHIWYWPALCALVLIRTLFLLHNL
ncbi:hypothetical protein AWB85_05135 [Mycobacteroides immunogenum]|uniref:Uncharacterized protein n=1 Tax=Mycobacteroides immunogenum TaxID=83262 RepID=A0A179VK52_9MYCO|nr:hypothetical protein [Mycobacteroides immunogenum]OAT70696.1 hypothetical protein AWB85_05135 [Mycobacteroides immunogenum]